MASFSFLLLSSCFCVIFLYFLWSRRRFYKVAWQLPGPLGLPFIGLGIQMMNPERFLSFLERTSKKYACPYISWMGTRCFLYVNDPETVETIFNSPHCTDKGEFYRFLASAIGDGLFTSSSPRWNKHRRLINPAFSRQTINNFLPIFNAEADVLLQKFDTEGATDKLEIYEMLKKIVLEAACQTTMGKKMNFQNDGSSVIFRAFDTFTEVIMRRMLSPWLYINLFYRLSPLYMHQQKVVAILNDFVENLLQSPKKSANKLQKEEAKHDAMRETVTKAAIDVQQTKKMKKRGGVGDSDDDDVGSISKSKAIFVEQVRKHVKQGQLTWHEVRDEANVIMSASFETTSTALYLVCLCLAMHPEYQDKLYAELVEIFPGNVNDSVDKNSNKVPFVTNAHLERMTYTEMVINEGMRLIAPVPMVLRTASNDFHLRDGTVIPRGTQICIDIFNMQRSPEVWGPRAHLFDPEHFSAVAMQEQHAFAFVPFTHGLRMCIGYRYALMLMKVLVAKIFRNFRIHTDVRLEDVIVKGSLSLKLREYPLCVVTRR